MRAMPSVMISNFIVIDDDPINNTLCNLYIKAQVQHATVNSFTNALDALGFLKENIHNRYDGKTIILLDINMPVTDGWDFLKLYDELSRDIKNNYEIYMLSSSVNALDKEMAAKDVNVCGYFEKPLSTEKILQILHQ